MKYVTRMDPRRIVWVLAVIAAGSMFIGAQAPGDKPLASRGFRVEIDGVDAGQFESVAGIGVALEVLEVATVPGDPVVRKIPGRLKYHDITLKRGAVASSEFAGFFEQVRQGANPNVRKDLSITYLAPDGNEIETVSLSQCFLQSYSIGPFDRGKGTDVLEEEVTFSCDYFVVEAP